MYKIILLFVLFTSNFHAQTDLLSLEELENKPIYSIIYNDTKGFIHVDTYPIYSEKSFDSVFRSNFNNFNIVHDEIYRVSLTVQIEGIKNLEKVFHLLLENFPNLQELHFVGIMSQIPSSVFKFKKLQYLDLDVGSCDNCQLYFSTIPKEFNQLVHLKKLKLSNLSWCFIPNHLFKSDSLKEVFISIQNETEFLPPVPANWLIKQNTIDYSLIYPGNMDVLFSINSIQTKRLIDLKKYGRIYDNEDSVYFITKKESKNQLKWFDKKNQLIIQGEIDNDQKPHGTWKVFYPSGKIKEIRKYKHGDESGKWKMYNESGKYISKYLFKKNNITFTHYRKSGIIESKFYVTRESDSQNYQLNKIFKRSNFDWFESRITRYHYQNDILTQELKLEKLLFIPNSITKIDYSNNYSTSYYFEKNQLKSIKVFKNDYYLDESLQTGYGYDFDESDNTWYYIQGINTKIKVQK